MFELQCGLDKSLLLFMTFRNSAKKKKSNSTIMDLRS